MPEPDWRKMTIEFLGVAQTLIEAVGVEIEEAIPEQPRETRASATAAYAVTSRLASLCRGMRHLLKENEIEAASVFLRPMLEVAAAGAYLQRAKPADRERLARRYLLVPYVQGPLKYLRAMVDAKIPEAKELKQAVSQMESLEAEFKGPSGKVGNWHGGGGVRDVMSGAGLKGHNVFFIELLHADMHNATVARFIRRIEGRVQFMPRGEASPTITAVPMLSALWSTAYLESKLITETTRAALLVFAHQALALQGLLRPVGETPPQA